MIDRRAFLIAASAVWISPAFAGPHMKRNGAPMYGLIGRIVATPGRRDELMQILLDGSRDMPGCLSYVVAADSSNEDSLWITEVWVDQASHRASLSIPAVQAAITRGRPLIAGFEDRFETEPIGGHGLGASNRE